MKFIDKEWEIIENMFEHVMDEWGGLTKVEQKVYDKINIIADGISEDKVYCKVIIIIPNVEGDLI